MKKHTLYILFFMISFYTKADQTLIWRLNNINRDNIIKSLDNIKNYYPEDFNYVESLDRSITDIESNRNKYIEKLKSGDTKTINHVKSLLNSIDNILLKNPIINQKSILVIRRQFEANARNIYGGSCGLAPSNFQNNSEIHSPDKGWNNEFEILKINDGKIDRETLYKEKEGKIIADPELHFDGKKILYSSIGSNNRWHLFELDINTLENKQITPDAYKDFDSFDGCYTADDKYIFCATGTFLGLPCTDGWNKMCGLFKYDPVTGKTRQLTFDQDSNWDPVILPNGKILYQRWEYADLAHSNSRIVFTMNPDGTEQKAYYGSNSYFPTSVWGIRPIPNNNAQFIATVSGHHSVSRAGQLMLFDTSLGRKEADGVVGEFPYFGKKVQPIVRDRLPDGVYPHFLHPFPLNDKYNLVVMKPSPNSLWGLYLVDVFNNVSLIIEDEDCAYFNPLLLEPSQRPPVIPERINTESDKATVYIQDIYQGDGLKNIPKGTVKKLRIGSYAFSPFGQGGLLGTIGMDGPWDIKYIEGIVDVEDDGSASFEIPANTPIFIQPLDDEGKALQIMRSWMTAMPGEVLACIGCHEDQRTTPTTRSSKALRKAPQKIRSWYGEARGFSYENEVQPILDHYCVKCHNDNNNEIPSFEKNKKINDWISNISGRVDVSIGGKFSKSYANLHRYVRRPGIESDLDMLTPMDVHADQTELIQILQKGHNNIILDNQSKEKLFCWIDFNTPYYGRRKDIPKSDSPHVCRSYEMRKLYSEMFQVKHRDLDENLPVQNSEFIIAVNNNSTVNTDTLRLKNWPIKNSDNFHLKTGNYQKRIYINDDIYINVINIPSGKFIMGSDRNKDEMPICEVDIKDNFWISEFEITNEIYQLYDSLHDSRTEHRHGYQFGRLGYPLNNPWQPVVRISWNDAMEFCKWLSEKIGMKVNLPTEAQWEWACRAGSDMAFSFGEINSDFSNFANLGDIRLKEFAACTAHKNYESVRIIDNPSPYDDWVPRDQKYDDGSFVSERAGRFRPNNWEIYDMHGNVWEWTRSEYKPYPYEDNDGRNNKVSKSGKRVVRGGSWYDRPYRSTSSYRLSYREYQKVFNVGFRIVIED